MVKFCDVICLIDWLLGAQDLRGWREHRQQQADAGPSAADLTEQSALAPQTTIPGTDRVFHIIVR